MKFNKLIPELSVNDIEKSKHFYIDILGFKVEYERKESKFIFISYEGSQIMLDEIKENEKWKVGELSYPYGRGINFQIEVTNVEKIYNNLKINNYDVLFEIEENWYRQDNVFLGNKEFLVKDPDGYLLRFCEDLGEKMYDVEKTKDQIVIDKVLNRLNIKYKEHKYFTDGASSRVILLNNYYLIKMSNVNALKSEVEYLNLNKSNIMQKVIYIDENYDFVVYEFIKGNVIKSDTIRNESDAKKLVGTLKKVVDNYQEYNGEGYGYLYNETDAWSEFLKEEVEGSKNAYEYININDMYNSINIVSKYKFIKKLLHGDFGTHNLIELDKELVGIIDPQPVIGDSIYDILFLIASNVNIVNNLNLQYILDIINEPKKKVLNLFSIVMYCRIHRCIKYHKQDLSIYLNKYKEIQEKIKESMNE